MSEDGMRQCTKCGGEFPATPQYFYKLDSWLRRVCKVCDIAEAKERNKKSGRTQGIATQSSDRTVCRIASRTVTPAGWRSNKLCTSCNRILSLTEMFHRNKGRPDGFAGHCKDCSREQARLRYILNRDRYLETSKNRQKRNREQKRKALARWRAKNNNGNYHAALRRSRQSALPSNLTKKDWNRCLSYWEGRCAYCGRPSGLWHTIAQEHFVPMSKGGGYTPDNIIPACHGVDGCNNSKHNKSPHDWLTFKFGKHKAAAILARIEAYFDWTRNQKK